jgi:hypothetical protein
VGGGCRAGLRSSRVLRFWISSYSSCAAWSHEVGAVWSSGGCQGDVSAGQMRTHQLYDLEARDVAGEPARRDCRFKRYEYVGFTHPTLAAMWSFITGIIRNWEMWRMKPLEWRGSSHPTLARFRSLEIAVRICSLDVAPNLIWGERQCV